MQLRYRFRRQNETSFQVISQSTGGQIGRISRHLIANTHISEKAVVPEEDYNVSFSKDLPVAMKAVFLAAVFLLVSPSRPSRKTLTPTLLISDP